MERECSCESETDQRQFNGNAARSWRQFFHGEIELVNSEIVFSGTNNHISVDGLVKLVNSRVVFDSDNSLLYLRSSVNMLCRLGSNTVVFIGKGFQAGNGLSLFTAESANIIIGDDALISTNVSIFNNDFHGIYDALSLQRMNWSESVVIGDHVWIGDGVKLLKGINVGSGAIVGTESVVTNDVQSNAVAAGNPARIVSRNKIWVLPHLRLSSLHTKSRSEIPGCIDSNEFSFLLPPPPPTHTHVRRKFWRWIYGIRFTPR